MKTQTSIQTFRSRFEKPVIVSSHERKGKLTISDKKELAFEIVKGSLAVSPEILLDFGKKTTGFVIFQLNRSVNADIIIEYGPTEDSIFFKSELVLGHMRGREQIIHSEFLAMRYMRIKIKENAVLPGDSELEISSLALKFSAYPTDEKVRFSCDNERLNSVWNVGAYTTQLCLQKHEDSFCYTQWLPEENKKFLKEWKNPYTPYVIWDGPRRDREVWMGDVRTEALTSFYSLGLRDVIQSSLQIFADLQLKDGNIPASATSRQNFQEYSFWWIITLAEYLRFTDDRAFFDSLSHVYKDLMGWVEQVCSDGFVNVDNTWMWTLGLNGKVGEAQCVLYRCYYEASWIEKYSGHEPLSAYYGQKASEIRDRINETFWDEDRGIYVDRFIDEKFDDLVFLDFNVYAATLGIADRAKRERLLTFIKENMWTEHGTITYSGNFNRTDDKWGHDQTVWPFVVGYELEALFLTGRTQDAFELIERCWGTMLNQGASTYWEFKGNEGEFPVRSMIANPMGDNMCSYCHGWSGWVSYIQQRYIAGITALSPGFSMIMIDPQLGDLETCRGSVETDSGPFTVSYDASEEGVLRIDIEKPLHAGVFLRTDREDFSRLKLIVNGEEFTYSDGDVMTEYCHDLPEQKVSLIRLPE